jgi:hypothetical protein
LLLILYQIKFYLFQEKKRKEKKRHIIVLFWKLELIMATITVDDSCYYQRSDIKCVLGPVNTDFIAQHIIFNEFLLANIWTLDLKDHTIGDRSSPSPSSTNSSGNASGTAIPTSELSNKWFWLEKNRSKDRYHRKH